MNDPPTQDSREAFEANPSSWLLHHRVTVPEPPADYCERHELAGRCTPTRQRVTALAAPAGFGKTTLLAAGCRSAVARGVPVAWLTLAAEDDAAALDAYIAFAFQRAGIDVLGRLRAAQGGFVQRYTRTAAVLSTLEAIGQTCVLALDELERVEHADAVALLSYLLRNAPPCLHVAMAYRQLPRGLDVADGLLGGNAEILTVEDLSFSNAEIARFFDLALSRHELADIAAESGGWPMALRIWRNETRRQSPGKMRVARNVFDNWIEGRLLSQLPSADRELVLDLGLFDWVDAGLFEEVAGMTGVWHQVTTLPGLAGLLEPDRKDAPDVYRLHPLLRDHCAAERRRRTPERYRETHRRIGRALARRRHTVAAMRHAAEAGDPALAGGILVDAGGLQWWFHEGTDPLLAASSLLTEETVASNSRLAVTHCVALAMSGRLAEARRVFRGAVAAANAAGAVPVEPAFQIDLHFARALLAFLGCESTESARSRAVCADARRLARSPTTGPVLQGAMSVGACYYHNQRGEFDAAIAAADRARQMLAGASGYLTISVDAQLGQIAMAQGRVRDALTWYQSAQRAAKRRFLGDPHLIANVESLVQEIALERNRLPDDIVGARFARAFYRGGAWLPHYAAAAEVALACALDSGGADTALSVLDGMWAHARKEELTTLVRLLAALRVSLLADAGRPAEAQNTWREAALPTTDTDCLDLDGLNWREMEAIACARLRLLTALGAHDAGRRLADAVVRLTAERGLLRTRLRALALRVRLELDAAVRGDARPHLAEYLQLYARTDYARPMVALGTAAMVALEGFIAAEKDGPLAAIAERLLTAAHAGTSGAPQFTDKEIAVLRRLPGRQDKQIAAALGLTPHGVRHHLRSIFRKLGVNTRDEAVRRARAVGFPGADEKSADRPSEVDV